MVDIVFVSPCFHYDSYTDFRRLIELSGFESCYLQEVNLRRNCTYILSPINFEWKPLTWWQRKTKNARIILWDLERPWPRGGVHADKRFLAKKNFDEIWVSDIQLARDIGARYVILGSDEKLGNKPYWVKRYDLTHISYENGRRATIYEQLSRVGPNGWGKQRDRVLRQTRFGLTVHQDNDNYTEPLRLAIFAAYELPVISEVVHNAFPVNDYLLTANYNRIADYAGECLGNYSRLKELGREIKQKLCFDYRFKNVVRYTAMQ